MSKICPNCQAVFDDDKMFCTQCGTKLEDQTVVPESESPEEDSPMNASPALSLGDANAISGGVHIDQSTHVESHDVHYHTIQQSAKSDMEVEQENRERYREAANQWLKNGVVSNEARTQLNNLKTILLIDDETAAQIEEAVKGEQKAMAASQGLSQFATMNLKAAIADVQKNHPETKKNLVKLAGICTRSTDEQAHFYYYMLLAAFKPQQCVEKYQQRTEDSYWQSFWTSLAYYTQGLKDQADDLLNEINKSWDDHSETDVLIGACVGMLMTNQDDEQTCRDTIVDYLNQATTEPSALLNDLFHALLHKVEMEDAHKPEYAFYEDQFFTMAQTGQKEETDEYDTDMDQAADAYERKDFATALSLWKKWADRDDTYAMNLIGLHYWQNDEERDMLQTYQWFLKSAELGHSQAQTALGHLYHLGEGIPQDDAEALKWFLKAAEQNNQLAQTFLGEMYYDGSGVPQNYTEAFKWFLKAVNQDDAIAEDYLGDMYYFGHGMKQDYAAAFKWYSKAAEQGDAAAQCSLGHLYYFGHGVGQDYGAAYHWLSKAAEQNNNVAMETIGIMYNNGKGVPKDQAEAAKWFRKAAEKGNASAKRRLGMAYKDGEGVPEDVDLAVKWLREASEEGDSFAQYQLGNMYLLADGIPRDPDEAKKWLQLAADQGEEGAKASLLLFDAVLEEAKEQEEGGEEEEEEVDECARFIEMADNYYNGKGVAKNYPEAYKYYMQAAKLGNPYAQSFVAFMRQGGVGVKQDFQEAAKYYQMAADQGYPYAQRKLGLMYEKGEGVKKDLEQAKKWLGSAVKAGYKDANNDFQRVSNLLVRPQIEKVKVYASPEKEQWAVHLRYGIVCKSGGFFCVKNTCKSEEGLCMKDKTYLKIDKDGFTPLLDEKGNPTKYSRRYALNSEGSAWDSFVICLDKLGIHSSGVYTYEGTLSVYNGNVPDDLLVSKDYVMKIQYYHKLLFDDAAKIIDVKMK